MVLFTITVRRCGASAAPTEYENLVAALEDAALETTLELPEYTCDIQVRAHRLRSGVQTMAQVRKILIDNSRLILWPYLDTVEDAAVRAMF